jgi:hypothetical protein
MTVMALGQTGLAFSWLDGMHFNIGVCLKDPVPTGRIAGRGEKNVAMPRCICPNPRDVLLQLLIARGARR